LTKGKAAISSRPKSKACGVETNSGIKRP